MVGGEGLAYVETGCAIWHLLSDDGCVSVNGWQAVRVRGLDGYFRW